MVDFSRNKLKPEQQARWRVLAEMFPSTCFVPNRPQYELIKAVGSLSVFPKRGEKKKRIFLLTSANGTGKTTGVENLLLQIIYRNNNIYQDIEDLDTGEKISGFFDFPLYNNFPSNWPRKIWYVSKRDNLEQIHEEFTNWAPKGQYFEEFSEDKNGKNYVSRVKFKNKPWVMFYKTIDQDPAVFESANVSIVIFDEPPPRAIFKAAVFRLRKGGIIIIPATPLFGAGWFVDDIVEKIAEDGDKWWQKVDIFQNGIETGGKWDLGMYGIHPKGVLQKEDIEFMIANADPDEYDARIKGEFMHLAGLVFKSYIQDLHLAELPPAAVPREYVYRFIVDPHDRKAPAAIWQRMDRYGRKETIREWPSVEDKEYHGKLFIHIKDSGKYTIDDFVRIWMAIEEELDIPPDRITDIMDPNFGNKKSAITGKLTHEEYAKASRKYGRKRGRKYTFVLDAVDDLAIGHKALKAELKPGSDGDPGLLIDKGCKNSDLAFRRYKYKEYSAKQEEEKGLSEIIEEKYKDFIDLHRYSAVIPWKWKEAGPIDEDLNKDYGVMQVKWKKRLKRRPKGAF